jgi:diguanylate cyclase (GGDEF)-like protein
MTQNGFPPAYDEDEGGIQDDLHRRVSGLLLTRAELVASDAVAVFPLSGAAAADPDYGQRIGLLLVQALGNAVRDARIDARDGVLTDLFQLVLERAITVDQLFTFAYLAERSALDELALDERLGATSEPWPAVAQLVRRASFDLMAAYAERLRLEPDGTAIIDRLTTLYTRPVLDAELAKALDGAGRFGDRLSLILFDVDRLAAINAEFGYGVGDRILERLGILIRGFFRQHDWVARHSEDSIAVLLSRADAQAAAELAEHVLATVQERLEFVDHRTEQPVRVTLTAAIVNVVVATGEVLDPERLLADAESALERAKRGGRNRVERVDGYSGRPPAIT